MYTAPLTPASFWPLYGPELFTVPRRGYSAGDPRSHAGLTVPIVALIDASGVTALTG